MESRPWGEFHVLHESNCKIKRILVLPLQRLSLQSHEHRKEYWIVLYGRGIAQKGDDMHPIQAGDVITIEQKEKHRLINTDEQRTLELIEVQTGDYLGEDDIVRYQDDYQRVL